ncbi:EAL domain-containing protein [Tepidimonas charontis]|uniref:Cyclic di-GMP phosphodiesterase YfgF n=1 Tax=Tepidimonas charontis TaxID=2267262 RepID=A0A554XKQ9_9BURK|nr:EAL domain-containing protein [Tepidimonas charontis]TSE36399.1 Cyclic di-GMP phosphodiesterase YfgF [Tepidimonas charontis]
MKASLMRIFVGALVVAALAEASRQLAFADGSFSLLWPVAGVGPVLLLRWRVAGLAALVLGMALWAVWRYGHVWMWVPVITLAGVVGPIAVAGWVRTSWNAEPQPFHQLSLVLRWLWAQLLVAAPLAASVGTLAVMGTAAGGDEGAVAWVLTWVAYWAIESIGALLLTPLLWGLSAPAARPSGTAQQHRCAGLWAGLRCEVPAVAVVLALASAIAAGYGVLEATQARGFAYLLLPALLVVAYRSPPEVLHALLALTGVVLTGASAYAMRGQEGVPAPELIAESILLVLFLLVSAAVLLVLAAVQQERRQALARLRQWAFEDSLTGLANEAGLQRIWAERTDAVPAAALLVRLTNARAIEYLDGPRVLQAWERTVANALQGWAPTLIWARMATGRFVGTAARVSDVALPLQGWLERLQTLSLRDVDAALHASVRPAWRVGMVETAVAQEVTASVPAATSDRPSLSDLLLRLRELDLEPGDDAQPRRVVLMGGDRHRLRDRTAEVEHVRSLIERGRLLLMLQPIVSVQQPAKAAGEVLARLVDEDGTVLSPAQFIPAAMRAGLMPNLDRAVMEHACALFARFRHVLPRIDYCSLNLSGAKLARPDLAQRITRLFADHQLPPERFTFEITESQAIAQLRDAEATLTALRQQGFRVAIDDFGTGHATFDYLKRFAIDILKIDGAFIRNVANDAMDRVIVRSVVEVARLRKVKTVAEFIEDATVWETVRALGVDAGQGYHLGRPEPLEGWLQRLETEPEPTVANGPG